MRLLLVDDDEIVRCILVGQLAEAGHIVDESVDGIDALVKINSTAYDAIICDWEMPRLDGPALCRVVRSGPRGHDLPFILLTGKDTAIEEADGYDAGVDTFLTKPCDPVELLAALRTAQSISGLQKRKAS